MSQSKSISEILGNPQENSQVVTNRSDDPDSAYSQYMRARGYDQTFGNNENRQPSAQDSAELLRSRLETQIPQPDGAPGVREMLGGLQFRHELGAAAMQGVAHRTEQELAPSGEELAHS
jgi:hypothetical protein